MNAPPECMPSIRSTLHSERSREERFLHGAERSVDVRALLAGTSLGVRGRELAGRSVMVATHDPFAAALALVELDGVVGRLIVCTPDVTDAQLPAVIEKAAVDTVVTDRDRDEGPGVASRIRTGDVRPAQDPPPARCETEWVLMTSGTSGSPKMVVHTLATLTAAIRGPGTNGSGIVWGTFYDIRRYGGLQILLRALLGCASFVMTDPDEPVGEYLQRLAVHGVTHLSGTPSHWRRVLMSPDATAISPRYVRLSGEIADQGILNALRSAYPQARIAHAFASTEAGVGFEVDDGREGFPAGIVDAAGDVRVRVDDGSLHIRSPRAAIGYLGEARIDIADTDGFVDTGDMVERRGERYYFLGRRSGLINVGGLKVYPEEIEAAINLHPAVRMSRVRSTRNPITGSLVAADVVLNEESDRSTDFRREILQHCRNHLADHKVPATIRFVPSLDLNAGKVARHRA
jgi:acyl-coenzyme A synthetase/AMP-(fatty) acid ligase